MHGRFSNIARAAPTHPILGVGGRNPQILGWGLQRFLDGS